MPIRPASFTAARSERSAVSVLTVPSLRRALILPPRSVTSIVPSGVKAIPQGMSSPDMCSTTASSGTASAASTGAASTAVAPVTATSSLSLYLTSTLRYLPTSAATGVYRWPV